MCVSVCRSIGVWTDTGKEVGVCIDKAVNEVIGRIDTDPKGTMSVSSCGSVSLSLSVCLEKQWETEG